jgi:hypothetical protein
MLWHSSKSKQKSEESDLSVGQRFDLMDSVIEIVSRAGGGSKNPLNWATATMGAADVSISSGMAKRGNHVGAGASAVAGQVTGMTGYVAGATAGEVLGTFILPVVGTWIGGIVGGGVGSLAGDKFGRSTTQRLFNTVSDTRPRVRFGGFKDSQPAYTMRQASEQQLRGSLLNARRYLGAEAQLFHQ